MGDLGQIRELWDVNYSWPQGGEEWSVGWGGADLQWLISIFPRISRFVPAPTILEIAPGFGRWTQYLKNLCERLVIVDISSRCIQACRERFAAEPHISYHVNDGKALDMIPDGSVDLVFSYDSLVHVEADVMEAYLSQLARKLTPEGVGFLHHSNLGEYRRYAGLIYGLPRFARKFLRNLKLLDKLHGRGLSMSAAKFREYAESFGMQCLSQEIHNWFSIRLIDCISLFTPKGSRWARPLRIIRNPDFVKEADYARRLAEVYDGAALWNKLLSLKFSQ